MIGKWWKMSLLAWSVSILIGLMFLAGLSYIVWGVVAKIRLSKSDVRENIDILMDLYERGEITHDEYRDRMRDIE
jgi:uncharacterized membrane protein